MARTVAGVRVLQIHLLTKFAYLANTRRLEKMFIGETSHAEAGDKAKPASLVYNGTSKYVA